MTPPTDPTEGIDGEAGVPIPGGCDHCNAYRLIDDSVTPPNLYVFHDYDCPAHGTNAGQS